MTAFSRTCALAAALGAVLVWSGCKVSAPKGSRVVHLLNHRDLSAFYSFLKGFGVDKDPDHVFTLTNGMLRISGQHYGYLATKETNFANYKLVAEFKWGQQTWPPRSEERRV